MYPVFLALQGDSSPTEPLEKYRLVTRRKTNITETTEYATYFLKSHTSLKPVNPKGNQPWIFLGRIDAETEAPILWSPDTNSWLIGKDPDAGKDWEQEEKGVIEDEMVGWHHQLNGHEFEQAPGDREGQGSLVCFSP